MARLVADSLELQSVSNGYMFEITQGGLDAHPDVRGSDTIIPGKAGREFRDRITDVRPITLHGIVMGAEGSSTAESFRTRMDALKLVFDPVEDPFPLTIHAPLHGLTTGESATLNIRFLRFVSISFNEHYRLMDIECECVDSSPEWVVSTGS